MKKTKEQKGITLIALIITIVVLLILAIVTIRAIQGDDILRHARDAATETEKAQEKEEILLAVNRWKIEKRLNPSENFKSFMDKNIKDKTNISGNNEGPLTITMKSGNQHTVTSTGKFIEGWIDNGDGSYTKDGITVKIGDIYTNAQVLDKLGIKASEYEGTYGTKTNEKWTVIGFEGEKIKLASTTNVASSVVFGWEDPGAMAAIPVEEGQEVTSEIKLKRAIWSYNHMKDTLKKKVETATKGIEGARSITLEDLESKYVLNITDEQKRTLSSNNYGRKYKYYLKDNKIYSQYLDWGEEDKEPEDTIDEGWSNEESEYGRKLFISYNKRIDETEENRNNVVKLKSNYYNPGSFTGTPKNIFSQTLANGSYWLASPCVDCRTSEVHFRMIYVLAGEFKEITVFMSGGALQQSQYGVHAVILI